MSDDTPVIGGGETLDPIAPSLADVGLSEYPPPPPTPPRQVVSPIRKVTSDVGTAIDQSKPAGPCDACQADMASLRRAYYATSIAVAVVAMVLFGLVAGKRITERLNKLNPDTGPELPEL